jgi:NAD+ synthase (glutamine-hydrolysing)
LAQINLLVGDVRGNLARVISESRRAYTELAADLVMFPELALSGYPPEDLLFHRGMRTQIERALQELRQAVPQIGVLFGYPEYDGEQIYNAAQLVRGGEVLGHYRKSCLPNYRVFDEKRYFAAGSAPALIDFDGYRLGLMICEDTWDPAPARAARRGGAEALLIINASPYEIHKQREREQVVGQRIGEVGLPVVYLNLIGGQDELVFDGNSFVMDASGRLAMRAGAFEEGLFCAELTRGGTGAAGAAGDAHTAGGAVVAVPGVVAPELSDEQSVYRALVMGVRDYVLKHGFPGAVMGLSGGVDSALTLAVAVDALGAERVHAVMMPSRYTSQMSREDAAAQAQALGVSLSLISIEGMFEATLAALHEEFAGRAPDATEENIQARCRGLLLMAISNKTGRMLLTTGNKSEMAVGYATLYGDMAGGFAPIKDCSKMLVWRLARYRNSIAPVIPQRVIEREPSAELRPDQKDSDSLPPYEVLDAILEAFIEEDLSVEEICERGFERPVVARVLDMVKRAEYKRRQAPPGVRVSRRAFGRDWRYPITNGYRR